MKCPECERTGQRSKFYMPDSYARTLMGGSQSYYDEDGNRHYHEVNSSRGQAHCSNGHILNVTLSTKCEALGCDYGHDQSMTLVPPVKPEPKPAYIRFDNVRIAFPREPGDDNTVDIAADDR